MIWSLTVKEKKVHSPDADAALVQICTDCMQYEPADIASCLHWHINILRDQFFFVTLCIVASLFSLKLYISQITSLMLTNPACRNLVYCRYSEPFGFTCDSSEWCAEHFLVSVEPTVVERVFCSFTRPATFCTRWRSHVKKSRLFFNNNVKPSWHYERERRVVFY